MELQETSTVCGTKNCKVRNLEPGSRNRHTVSGYGYRGATVGTGSHDLATGARATVAAAILETMIVIQTMVKVVLRNFAEETLFKESDFVV